MGLFRTLLMIVFLAALPIIVFSILYNLAFPVGALQPGFSPDAKITQSGMYWRGQAAPFAIIDYTVTSDGTATFVLSAKREYGKITLKRIDIGGVSAQPNFLFGMGETKTVVITGLKPGAPGTTYNYGINITYIDSQGYEKTEIGAKELVGKYS